MWLSKKRNQSEKLLNHQSRWQLYELGVKKEHISKSLHNQHITSSPLGGTLLHLFCPLLSRCMVCDLFDFKIILPCFIIIRSHTYKKQLGRGEAQIFEAHVPWSVSFNLSIFQANLQYSLLGFSFAVLLQRLTLLKMYTLLPYPRLIHLRFLQQKFHNLALLRKAELLCQEVRLYTQWGKGSFNLDTCVQRGMGCTMGEVFNYCKAMILFYTLSSFTFIFIFEVGKPSRYEPH